MHLLIPGSLPPSTVAADLIPHVREHCPELVRRMELLACAHSVLAPEETGCTALEYLHLVREGYVAQAGNTFGAGLAPWRAGISQPNEPVWIADLCSVAIGREGAQMAMPESLQIEQFEADALFETAQTLWSNTAISILPIESGRWRVWLPPDAQLTSISPAAVCSLSIADWWPQHPSMKTWRKLLNEVQMMWHDHPVNLSRSERGLHPINSLWLYGGTPGWKPISQLVQTETYSELNSAFLNADWAGWITKLSALSEYLRHSPEETAITLVGERRLAQLKPLTKHWWQKLLPPRKQNWTNWWTSQQ